MTIKTELMVATGVACIMFPQLSDAAVVQITLIENFINESVDQLDYDLTGSGEDPGRILIGGQDYIGTRSISANSARVGLDPDGRPGPRECPFTWPLSCISLASAGQTSNSGGVSVLTTSTERGSAGGFESDYDILGTSVSTLTEFSFRDPRFGEDPINGWLQIDASTSYSMQDGPQAQISLMRVLWDDENIRVRPEGLLASDGDYPEARPIPEPSSLAMLTLVAVGHLTRRRRSLRRNEQ